MGIGGTEFFFWWIRCWFRFGVGVGGVCYCVLFLILCVRLLVVVLLREGFGLVLPLGSLFGWVSWFWGAL